MNKKFYAACGAIAFALTACSDKCVEYVFKTKDLAQRAGPFPCYNTP